MCSSIAEVVPMRCPVALTPPCCAITYIHTVHDPACDDLGSLDFYMTRSYVEHILNCTLAGEDTP
jgi:hypothetical protein